MKLALVIGIAAFLIFGASPLVASGEEPPCTEELVGEILLKRSGSLPWTASVSESGTTAALRVLFGGEVTALDKTIDPTLTAALMADL